MTNTPHTQDRLLPTAVVLDRICMSKTQLYRLIAAGEFPKPVPIGRHRIGFLESEVYAWIVARADQRDERAGVEMRRQRAVHAVSASRNIDKKKPSDFRSREDAERIFEEFLQSIDGSSVEFWWVNLFDGRVATLECFHRDAIEKARDRLVHQLRCPDAEISAAPHVELRSDVIEEAGE